MTKQTPADAVACVDIICHLKTLVQYQAWRRDKDTRTLVEIGLTPRTIGIALDWAIAELDKTRWRVLSENNWPENGDHLILHIPLAGYPDYCACGYWDAMDGQFYDLAGDDLGVEVGDIERWRLL